MTNKNKIFADVSKFVSDAFSTFSEVKKEIETIVRLRVEKTINKLDLVKRDEFEALKKVVQKLASEKKVKRKKTKKKPKLSRKKGIH